MGTRNLMKEVSGSGKGVEVFLSITKMDQHGSPGLVEGRFAKPGAY
jgi:hypothetical protein